MGIFRVEKVKDYTTISNYHLRDKRLSLKAKGLLTMILALPEDWNFTIRGLSAICKEGVESIGTALKELEKGGYLVRKRVRGADGRMNDTEYNFYEEPIRQTEEQPEESDDGQSGTEEPEMETSEAEQPHTEKPDAGNSVQSNTHISKTYSPNTHKSNPYPSHVQVYEADGYDGMGNCVDVQTWNRIHAEVERHSFSDRSTLWNAVEKVEKSKNAQLARDIEIVSYFCWSLTNKNESSALLAPGSSKTGKWKKKDLSEAGRYLRKKYRAKR